MPIVNGKHYSYTKAGKKAAAKAKKYHETRGKFKSPQSKWRYDMTGGRML